MIKTGLVLSGGGAKGAYQVGVMHALNEMGFVIDMLSGASIGALNGAVLASASNLRTGAEKMHTLWKRLPEMPLLQFNQLTKTPDETEKEAEQSLWHRLKKLPDIATQNSTINSIVGGIKEGAVFTDAPLQKLIDEFLDIEQLQKSIPLYISIFKQSHILGSAKDILLAEIMGINNGESEFKQIQLLDREEQRETLLASAALPFLFKSRIDAEGKRMSDGGQGGWINAQGNTPISPLISAGCQRIIVTHLSNASPWRRQHFPQAVIYEIRPNSKLDLSSIKATFDFSQQKIDLLMESGYQDTKQQIGKIRDFLVIRERKRQIHAQLQEDILLSGTKKG